MKNEHVSKHLGAGEPGIPEDPRKASISAISAQGGYTRLDSYDFNALALIADAEAQRMLREVRSRGSL